MAEEFKKLNEEELEEVIGGASENGSDVIDEVVLKTASNGRILPINDDDFNFVPNDNEDIIIVDDKPRF